MKTTAFDIIRRATPPAGHCCQQFYLILHLLVVTRQEKLIFPSEFESEEEVSTGASELDESAFTSSSSASPTTSRTVFDAGSAAYAPRARLPQTGFSSTASSPE